MPCALFLAYILIMHLFHLTLSLPFNRKHHSFPPKMKIHRKLICPLRDVGERLQWASPGTHFKAWEKVDSARAGRRWWRWCVSVCVHMCVCTPVCALVGRCRRGQILEKAGLNHDRQLAAPAGPVWGPCTAL